MTHDDHTINAPDGTQFLARCCDTWHIVTVKDKKLGFPVGSKGFQPIADWDCAVSISEVERLAGLELPF